MEKTIGLDVARALHAERKSATRKGRMYVINIVVPVHPARVVEAANLKKQQVEEAFQKRKEQAAALQAKNEQEAKEVEANCKAAYEIIIKEMDSDKANTVNKKDGESAQVVIDTKGITNNDVYVLANQAHYERMNVIRSKIDTEKRQLLQQLETKKRGLEDEICQGLKRTKLAIDGAFAK